MIIKDTIFYWVRIPLKQPYHLSFKSVYYYDTILVRIVLEGGEESWGESTPLPGYSKATIKDAYNFTKEYSEYIRNKKLREARRVLLDKGKNMPFAASALLCAIDEIILKQEIPWQQYFKVTNKLSVPLVGLVKTKNPIKLEQNVRELIEEGYETLKVKVALPPVDIENDIKTLHRIREIAGEKINIRVDANQGYSTQQALTFLSQAQDISLQLFEQPIAVGLWKDMKLLFNNRGNVPIMLDEDILSMREVYLANEYQCANYIKLKAMKQGGLIETLSIAKAAQKLGFKVIIGNGVQTEIGCMQENLLHYLVDDTLAGEQNGFLKQKKSILKNPIPFNAGRVDLIYNPPNLEAIKSFIIIENLN